MTAKFRVVAAHDAAVQVPFEVPLKGGKVLEFSLPRLPYLSESVAGQMRENLLQIDAPVEQFDPLTKEPIWETDLNGQPLYVNADDEPCGPDDEGAHKVQLKRAPLRSVHEQTRATALAMLEPAVDADVFDELKRLTVGELDQILYHWTQVSGSKLDPNPPVDATDLGESSASSQS